MREDLGDLKGSSKSVSGIMLLYKHVTYAVPRVSWCIVSRASWWQLCTEIIYSNNTTPPP